MYAGTMTPRRGKLRKSARLATRIPPVAKKRVRKKPPPVADLPVEQQEKLRQQNRDRVARWSAKGGEEVKAKQRENTHNAYIKKTIIVSVVVIGHGSATARMPHIVSFLFVFSRYMHTTLLLGYVVIYSQR